MNNEWEMTVISVVERIAAVFPMQFEAMATVFGKMTMAEKLGMRKLGGGVHFPIGGGWVAVALSALCKTMGTSLWI